MKFDKNGFLIPYAIIETDLFTVERFFVDEFPHSMSRRRLFNNFLRYLENFKSRVSREFVLWLNGSFITQKPNPKDMDFVIFLDYRIYESQERFLDKFWTFSLEDEGLDAYLVKFFPESHEFHSMTLSDKANWRELYQTVKTKNETIKDRKGFLEIKFQ